MNDWWGLAGFVAAVMATAGSGAFFKPGAWYEGLRKPAWRPPNWLFAPAWAVLFVMIAASGWLVWRQAGLGLPIAVYALNLALNFAWSALFFGARRPDFALYDLMAMWLTIVALIALFAPISPAAAWLLVPYLAWTSFAGVLNATMWRLNGPRPA